MTNKLEEVARLLEKEVYSLRQENAKLRERCADFARAQARAVKQRNEEKRRLEVALRVAQHELDTIHGLFASDDPGLIDHTPAGVWRLDTSTAREAVDGALAKRKNRGESPPA